MFIKHHILTNNDHLKALLYHKKIHLLILVSSLMLIEFGMYVKQKCLKVLNCFGLFTIS